MAKAPGAAAKGPKKLSTKKLAKAKFYGKTNKLKKTKTNNGSAAKGKADGLVKGAWEKVKIAGNLITDDGGGLEGLIGLEVLEDYGAAVVATGGKRTYSDNDLDEDFALLTKSERKKKRQESVDKANELKAAKKAKLAQKPKAGAFVCAPSQAEDEDDGDDDDDVEVESASDDDAEEQSASDDDAESSEEPDSEADGEDNSDDDSGDEIFNESDVSDIEMEDETVETSIDDLVEWKKLNVNDLILRALAEKNFHTPTPIQALTLPSAILDRKDILGAAETGSGKTLAFGIPILNGILELKRNVGQTGKPRNTPKSHATPRSDAEATEASGASKKAKKKKHSRNGERDNLTPPREELLFAPASDFTEEQDAEHGAAEKPLYALVLTPTRELCVQVKDHLVTAAKYTGIQVVAIFGGLAHVKQERILRKCPEIVVATPGRLWELIRDGNEHLNKLRDISYLVIDETDRMVEKGHFEELKLLIAQLNADADRMAQRQNFVFSATLTLVHDLPAYVKGKKQKQAQQTSAQKIHALIEQLGISQPKVVDITKSTGTAERLTECRIVCELAQKDWYLYYFLQRHPGRTIVFCNSIDCVKRLGQLFALLQCQPRPLHAHMNQRQRLKNLERFTASESGLLIATDVAARGLDIPNVKHVIHYQVPRTGENYVHRSGRTARATNEGISVVMMEPAEVRDYMKLCRTLKRTEDLPLFPCSEKHLKAVKARVDLAREVDVLDLKSRRNAAEVGWLKKSAEEMDIIVDDMSDFSESELYDSDDGGERHRGRRELRQKRDNLTKLLGQPLFPKGYSYKYPTREGQPSEPSLVDGGNSNAVDVMKTAIEEYKLDKKKRNKKAPKI